MRLQLKTVTLEKKDIGFVSADGLQDEKRGSIFPATLTLDASQMNIDGKAIRLSPGMNVTAEIKTGQRRLIEYLLSSAQCSGRVVRV